jgi:hypothetical protein
MITSIESGRRKAAGPGLRQHPPSVSPASSSEYLLEPF